MVVKILVCPVKIPYHEKCYSGKLQALIYPPRGYLLEDMTLGVRNSTSDADKQIATRLAKSISRTL